MRFDEVDDEVVVENPFLSQKNTFHLNFCGGRQRLLISNSKTRPPIPTTIFPTDNRL